MADASWPPSRETLADLVDTHTQDEVGRLYGVQRTAVSKLAKRLGVEWPKEGRRHLKSDGQWPVSRAQLEKWLAEGLSSHDIAKRVNRSHSAVIRLRTKYGLAPAHPRGRKLGVPGDRSWNWRDMAKPKRTNGKFESVEAWLAAGNEITRCPDAYAAPIVSGSPYFSKHGARFV